MMIVNVIRVVVVVMTIVVSKVKIIVVFMITVLISMARYHVSKTVMINIIVIVTRVVTMGEVESVIELCCLCLVVLSVLVCHSVLCC